MFSRSRRSRCFTTPEGTAPAFSRESRSTTGGHASPGRVSPECVTSIAEPPVSSRRAVPSRTVRAVTAGSTIHSQQPAMPTCTAPTLSSRSMFGRLVGGNMKPLIIQKSHSGMLQVMEATDHVKVPWDWEDWYKIDGWKIIKLFRSSQLIPAIKWARRNGVLDPQTLRETLGSWDRRTFAPNPPPDEQAVALYRHNLKLAQGKGELSNNPARVLRDLWNDDSDRGGDRTVSVS